MNAYLSSRQVELGELIYLYQARTAEIAFSHEVLDVLLADREFEVA